MLNVFRLHIPTSLLWIVVSALLCLWGLWPVSDLGSGPSLSSNSQHLICCLASETHMHKPRVSQEFINDLMGSPSCVLPSLPSLGTFRYPGAPPFRTSIQNTGVVCTLLYLARPTTTCMSKAKCRQTEKRKAAGTCPHPLEERAQVTEEGSLRIPDVLGSGCHSAHHQEICLPFPKPERERLSWSSLRLCQCPFLGFFFFRPGQWMPGKNWIHIFIFSTDHAPKLHICTTNGLINTALGRLTIIFNQTIFFTLFKSALSTSLLKGTFSSQLLQPESLESSFILLQSVRRFSKTKHTPNFHHHIPVQAPSPPTWTTATGSQQEWAPASHLAPLTWALDIETRRIFKSLRLHCPLLRTHCGPLSFRGKAVNSPMWTPLLLLWQDLLSVSSCPVWWQCQRNVAGTNALPPICTINFLNSNQS